MYKTGRTGVFILIMAAVLVLTGCSSSGVKNQPPTNNKIMDLPPMKDQFSAYFMLGNIFNPGDVDGTEVSTPELTRHYNVLTAENSMKPYALSRGKGSYNWSTADSMVNSARASGFKVVGHTLLWHSQNASWMTGADANLNNMKEYVTDVVTHFKGKIYSWDVLNEAFPDGGFSVGSDWKKVIRPENPWYKTIGPDFVYEGFLAARLADPGAILYYNDYNLDQVSKATMVRNLVRDVNAEYKKNFPNETRFLIEGIGMQSHHNTGVRTSSIKATLNMFKELGVIISISELDILGQGYGDFAKIGSGRDKDDRTTVTATGLQIQAALYGEYMKLFIEYSDIIERVSFWGLTDDQSWRSAGVPLLFDSRGRAKDAYYKVIEALNK